MLRFVVDSRFETEELIVTNPPSLWLYQELKFVPSIVQRSGERVTVLPDVGMQDVGKEPASSWAPQM